MTRLKSFSAAAIASLGIAFAPVPAFADSSDIAKVIGGLAVLGIIAKTVDDRRDRRKAAAARNQKNTYNWNTIENNRSNRVIEGELRPVDRTAPRNQAFFRDQPLPDRCLRLVDTNRPDRLVYAKRCLNSRYQFTSQLPNQCQRQIRTSNGLRTVYGARCLARDGWQVAAR